MQLEGSCRCGAVRFRCTSLTPYPFMRCYCSICRKTAGGGGYAINIRAQADTLEVEGADDLTTWRAIVEPGDPPSPAHRHFCRHCAAALWIADEEWPDSIYPFASAIDTALPTPPERVHIMLDFKAPWVEVPDGPQDRHFARYPVESIDDWHKRHGVFEEPKR